MEAEGEGGPCLPWPAWSAKKVALLLSSAHCSPSPHTPLSVVVLVSFTCAGDLPATHLHILKFIINNAATTEWNKRGSEGGGLGVLAAWFGCIKVNNIFTLHGGA